MLGYDLLRPIDLYTFWLARALATRTAPTLLRAIPLLTLAFLFFGLHRPPSAAAGIAFALSLFGALALSATFTVLVNISLFWTISGEGIAQAVPAIVPFFAGEYSASAFIPPLDPTGPGRVAFPRHCRRAIPLYSGHLPASDFAAVVVHQWIWVAIFIFLGRWLLHRGVRRVVVQGG